MFRNLINQQRRSSGPLSSERNLFLGVATNNVSSPPTDAELDTAFGTAANLPSGAFGIVDDNNAQTAVYFCVVVGSTWWYESLTKAV